MLVANDFQVFRNWSDTRLPDAVNDPSGTGAMGTVNLTDAAPNKTWHVVINGVNATSPGWSKYLINVDALQCPLAGCPLPYRPVRVSVSSLTCSRACGVQHVVLLLETHLNARSLNLHRACTVPHLSCCLLAAEQVPGAFMNWSNPITWPSGSVPAADDIVTITRTMSVYLDVSPPPLTRLVIEGQLWFAHHKNLTLTVDGIVVFGELQVCAAWRSAWSSTGFASSVYGPCD